MPDSATKPQLRPSHRPKDPAEEDGTGGNGNKLASSSSSSSVETCGFVMHVLLLLLGLTYVMCVPYSAPTGDKDPSLLIMETTSAATTKTTTANVVTTLRILLQQQQHSACPAIDRWSLTVSAVLVVLFWTTPVVYFALNQRQAQSPSFNHVVRRMDNKNDENENHIKKDNSSTATTTPPSTASRTVATTTTTTTTATTTRSRTRVPNICHLDAAVVNDRFYEQYRRMRNEAQQT